MNILICYASTEGQTRKICRFAADLLNGLGHSVELLQATEGDQLDLMRFDRAILAGSVHVGAVQQELSDFAAAHAAGLSAIPSLFLLVSLAAAAEDPGDRAELERIASDFCGAAGWSGAGVHHIAGAFRFTQYDFFRSWAMRWIAHTRGQTVDPHSDREYTDWAALEGILKDWAGNGPGPG